MREVSSKQNLATNSIDESLFRARMEQGSNTKSCTQYQSWQVHDLFTSQCILSYWFTLQLSMVKTHTGIDNYRIVYIEEKCHYLEYNILVLVVVIYNVFGLNRRTKFQTRYCNAHLSEIK